MNIGYLVVVGNLTIGFEYYGLFNSVFEAEKWNDEQNNGLGEIVPVLSKN